MILFELLEDWKRWGDNSFWAFETALLERGQDISTEARAYEFSLIKKHLRGTLSVRNKMSYDGIKFRDGIHYQDRLIGMFNQYRALAGAV